jgi:type II secretory pathway pseudopilin PulG
MHKQSEISKRLVCERGFTMIEMVIALVILFIVVLGVFAAVTYATRWNRGNSQRSQALSVLQREVELLRSAKFTPAIVSNTTTATPTCASADDGRRDITGGTKAQQVRCAIDGNFYLVDTIIDDDPSTPGTVDVIAQPAIKQITINVTPVNAEGEAIVGANTWVRGNAIRAVFRRVRAN